MVKAYEQIRCPRCNVQITLIGPIDRAIRAEQVRLARWLRDEAYCLDGADQKGTRDTLRRHADCLDAMREAMGGE